MIKVLAQPAFNTRAENPYTWLLYNAMAAEVTDFSYRRSLDARYDIFHIHWPELELNAIPGVAEAAARLKLKLTLMDALRARGTRIVWTVHNLKAHEGLHPRLEQWFWPAFTRRLDGFIALTSSGQTAATERFVNLEHVPGYVIPHGHYRGEYPVNTEADARQELNLAEDAKVFLFFGQIREYKNVPGLIRAFRKLADADAILCIAGRPKPEGVGEQLRREAAGDPRIRLHLENIPKDRVQFFFRAANLVVLPYRDILNSGTAILALSFSRPILVPCRGAMGELKASVGPEWVSTFPAELDADKLERALAWSLEPRAQEAKLENLEWPQIADWTLEAYAQIVARHAS
ncbi:MAG: glycosyltransferase [Terriglobales bacterium]|jgi:glycosyltransferase involved in cell wall biosynthesis